jgi:hypothetical protein
MSSSLLGTHLVVRLRVSPSLRGNFVVHSLIINLDAIKI